MFLLSVSKQIFPQVVFKQRNFQFYRPCYIHEKYPRSGLQYLNKFSKFLYNEDHIFVLESNDNFAAKQEIDTGTLEKWSDLA